MSYDGIIMQRAIARFDQARQLSLIHISEPTRH